MILLIVCCLRPDTSTANEKSYPNLEELWKKVLDDPADVPNNIQYALKAEDEGFYQRAISAYIRALKNEPTSSIASQNLGKLNRLTGPAETSGTLIISGNYSANSSQTRRNPAGDTALSKTLLVADSRKFLSTRWNSSVVNFADAHSFLRDSDVNFTSVKSGPTWILSPKSTFNFSAVIDHTYIDKKTDSYAVGITGNYIPNARNIKNLTSTLKYTKGVNQGDLSYVNLGVNSFIRITDNFIFKNDYLALEPSLEINFNQNGFDGGGQRDRLVETNWGLTYSIGLSERQSMDVFQALQSSYYFKHRKSDPRDRIDLVHNIGFSYNYKVFDNTSTSLGFVREQRFSNFNEFHYVNYTTSASLIFSF